MREGTASLAVFSILVVGTAIVSGPLVPGVDLTPTNSAADAGQINFDVEEGEGPVTTNDWSGNVSIDVTSVPAGSIVFEKTRYEDSYTLTAPPAVLNVRTVSGQPILVYRLDIPELGVSSIRIIVLDETSKGQLEADLIPLEINSSKITQETYDGVIQFKIRGDDRGTFYTQNVTVTVEQ